MISKIGKKRIILFSSFVLLVLLIIIGIGYHIYSDSYEYLNTVNNRIRGIDSPIKLWLNGYLGIFFRIKKFGFLPSLMIPILIVFLWNFHRRENWQKILFFVYILTAMLIGHFGYGNYRYAFTLYPATVVVIFLFTEDMLSHTKRWVRGVIISFICFMICFSFIYNFKEFRIDSIISILDRYKSVYSGIFTDRGKAITKGNVDSGRTPRLSDNTKKRIRMSRRDYIKYLKNMDIDENNGILVCNVVEFFYFTDKKGFTYQRIKSLYDHKRDFLEYLTKKHKIRYVLTQDYIHVIPAYFDLSRIVKDKGKMLLKSWHTELYELAPGK